MAADAMLGELYQRAFQTKTKLEAMSPTDDENADRLRQVALAESSLLNELIDLRTEQIKSPCF